MSKVQVSFSTSPKMRDSAMAVANKLGLSLSTLLNMCLNQTVYQQRIPFSTNVPKYLRPDTDEYLEKAAKKFAKGNNGEKHHLID